jgi:phosphoribosylaminoimidazolecarboxamide formyltransferase/IMP cyclohydrolase
MNISKVALLSAFHKDDRLHDFARDLVELGWRLLASAGTKRFLDQHNIESVDVATIVGKSILGHRVVTLSREIHAVLLARLDNQDDLKELADLGIAPVSLVYVDLYPLADAMEKDERTIASVVDQTDIGGPTLLRSAAKGRRIVVSSMQQFDDVLEFLETDSLTPFDDRAVEKFVAGLAADAEDTVARYAWLSSDFNRSVADGTFADPRHGQHKSV